MHTETETAREAQEDWKMNDKPEIFVVPTNDGPEAVAAYRVGSFMVHPRIGLPGWGISHTETGYSIPRFVAKNKSDATNAAMFLDEKADWSTIKNGDDGVPVFPSGKLKFKDATALAIAHWGM